MIGREFSYELLAAVAPLPEPELRAALAPAGRDRARVPPRRAAGCALHLQARPGAGDRLQRGAARAARGAARPDRAHARGRLPRGAGEPAGADRPSLHRRPASTRRRSSSGARRASCAMARSAAQEAVAHLTSALAGAGQVPGEPPSQPHRARPADQPRRGADRGAQLRGAGDRAGLPARLAALPASWATGRSRCRCCSAAGSICIARAELDQWLAVAGDMLRLAEAQDDAGLLLVACRALANTEFFAGDLVGRPRATPSRRSPSTSRAATAVWRGSTAPTPTCCAPISWPTRCSVWAIRSRRRRARQAGAGPGARAGACGHARECACTTTACSTSSIANPLAVREQASALITFATEHGLPFWQALGGIFHGWARAESGQLEAGIAELQRGLAAYRATSGRLYLPYALDAARATSAARPASARPAWRRSPRRTRVIGATGVRGFEAHVASDRGPAAAGRARARAGRRRALLPPRR